MKYWAYFIAKIAAIAGLLRLVWVGMNRVLPEPETFLFHKVSRFSQDLPWTMALLIFWLLSLGLIVLAILDQRRRCRVCLRQLRMPVQRGFWSYASIFSPPEMESICPYGHGTLVEPEAHLAGDEKAAWKQHEDIWKELENLEGSGKK
jgi:hypothetical protein